MPLMARILSIYWMEGLKTISSKNNRMLIRKIFIVGSIAMMMYMDGRSQTITGRPLSLQECVQTAITNNLDVKQSNLSMEQAAITWRQSKANLLPNISGEIDHTLNQGRSIDLSTNSYVNQQQTSGSYSLSGNVT